MASQQSTDPSARMFADPVSVALRHPDHALVATEITETALESMLHMQHIPFGTMEWRAVADDLINEMSETCIVTRTRVISRVVSGIYDDGLRAFGINSPQFILLVIISKIGPVTRAALGRFHHQERSTLTRNLKIMLDNGWIEEVADERSGRGRPLAASDAGWKLLEAVEPAWRISQAKASRLLGSAGVHAIFDVGNGLIGNTG